MKRNHLLYGSSALMLMLAVFLLAHLLNGGAGGVVAAPARIQEDPKIEADLRNALKARHDAAKEELKIAERYIIGTEPAALANRFVDVVRVYLKATLDLTEAENPKSRLELLEPLLAMVRKAESHVEDHICGRLEARQGGSTEVLPAVRGVRLEVEIEILRARRSALVRNR